MWKQLHVDLPKSKIIKYIDSYIYPVCEWHSLPRHYLASFYLGWDNHKWPHAIHLSHLLSQFHIQPEAREIRKDGEKKDKKHSCGKRGWSPYAQFSLPNNTGLENRWQKGISSVALIPGILKSSCSIVKALRLFYSQGSISVNKKRYPQKAKLGLENTQGHEKKGGRVICIGLHLSHILYQFSWQSTQWYAILGMLHDSRRAKTLLLIVQGNRDMKAHFTVLQIEPSLIFSCNFLMRDMDEE